MTTEARPPWPEALEWAAAVLGRPATVAPEAEWWWNETAKAVVTTAVKIADLYGEYTHKTRDAGESLPEPSPQNPAAVYVKDLRLL
jgi:hypothetical protein